MTTIQAPQTTGLFTTEQEDLRDSARRFLADRSGSQTVRPLMETESGFDEGTWCEIAGLGWTGIAIPEAYGGLGFGFVELAVLLEEMGRRLLCAPFFSSVVLGACAILNAGSDEQKRALLPPIAEGTTRATFALTEPNGRWDRSAVETTARRDGDRWILDGTKSYVVDGHTATLIVVAADSGDGVGLFVIDPEESGVERKALQSLDMTRKLAKISLDSVPATRLSDAGWDEIERTLDQAAVALCAEMVGGAQQCLDMSVDHARNRTQFGRPIGSFQAVKHKCAEMLAAVEMSRSAAYYAAFAAADDSEELPVVAPLAKAYCSESFFRAAGETIQIHGGIGFTWEHDAHLYFRRAKSDEVLLGDPTYHRELLAQRIGL